MKIPETFRIKRSSCVHRAFTVHIALAFALRSRSAFAHRSGFTYRSPTCIQRSDIVHSAFAQRSSSVRSPFTHRSLIVRSPFKWKSKTFQGMQLLRSLDLKTRLDPLFHFCTPSKWQFLAMVQRIYPRRTIKNKFIPLQNYSKILVSPQQHNVSSPHLCMFNVGQNRLDLVRNTERVSKVQMTTII